MTTCPVCGAVVPPPFVVREGVPAHQNLPLPTPEEARGVERGRLSMCACERCGFVFNATFDPSLLHYDDRYDNTQTCSPEFSAHVASLIDYIVERRGAAAGTAVEVGCGKGLFLRGLVTHPASRLVGVGFDPTYVGADETDGGRVRFERRFYDADAADVPADVVISRHVIEHVPDPVALLRAVRHAVADRPEATVYFETPCVEWILRHRVVWDLFYEHCSLFTPASLTTAFQIAGFEVERVRHVFGGQYLWIEARPAAAPPTPTYDPGDIVRLADGFGSYEADLRARWARVVERVGGDHGTPRVAVWGAGAKGVTFAQLLDPACRDVDCYVDLNPNKQGRFIPGTGHPIVAPEALRGRSTRAIVVLNPNYVTEIAAWVAEHALDLPVIDLMAPDA